MRSKKVIFSIPMLILLFLFSACKPAQPTATPTTDVEALKKAAEQTASAFLTATAMAAPSQTLTATLTGTPTLSPATATASVTPTPPLAGTPTAPVVSGQGENALFVADVTVPDGTIYKPGDVFTKTWRIKNAGSSTWTAGYALAFIRGDKLGGPDRMGLLGNVAPGDTVDISVNLVAPTNPGKYRGFWRMINTAGTYFGDEVYVEINVQGGNTPTVTSTSAGVAPTLTPTQSSATLSISNVSMNVSPGEFTGTCPKTFTLTGKFTLNIPALITYKVEAGAEDPAFVFTLPAAQTSNFGAGEQTITYVLDFSNSVKGWVRLHLTAPIDVVSNQANFTLTCQP